MIAVPPTLILSIFVLKLQLLVPCNCMKTSAFLSFLPLSFPFFSTPPQISIFTKLWRKDLCNF